MWLNAGMQHYVFNWYALPPFFTALCAYSLGLWIIWQQPSSRLRKALLLGTTCTAVWLGCFGMISLSATAPTAMAWARAAHLGVPFLPMAVYFYVTVGLRQYERDKPLIWISAAISVAFLVLSLSTRLVIADVERHWWGFYPLYGPAGGFLCGYFAVAIVLGLAKLRARLKETLRSTAFARRITLSAVAGVVLALTSVDFFADLRSAGLSLRLRPRSRVPRSHLRARTAPPDHVHDPGGRRPANLAHHAGSRARHHARRADRGEQPRDGQAAAARGGTSSLVCASARFSPRRLIGGSSSASAWRAEAWRISRPHGAPRPTGEST